MAKEQEELKAQQDEEVQVRRAHLDYFNDQLAEQEETGDIDEKFLQLHDQGYFDVLHDLHTNSAKGDLVHERSRSLDGGFWSWKDGSRPFAQGCCRGKVECSVLLLFASDLSDSCSGVPGSTKDLTSSLFSIIELHLDSNNANQVASISRKVKLNIKEIITNKIIFLQLR